MGNWVTIFLAFHDVAKMEGLVGFSIRSIHTSSSEYLDRWLKIPLTSVEWACKAVCYHWRHDYGDIRLLQIRSPYGAVLAEFKSREEILKYLGGTDNVF